jgi:hypothetical protein
MKKGAKEERTWAQTSLKPAATKSVPIYRKDQVMLEMVRDLMATDVTRLVGTAAVLRYGKQMDRVTRC